MDNQYDPFIILIYLVVDVIAPLLLIVAVVAVVVLLVRWIYSFLVAVSSPDGGWNWREQRHRHHRENLVLWMSIACLIAGTLLAMNGFGEGNIIMRLPGGLVIENAGIGVVLVGVMCFIVWVLLRLPQPSQGRADVPAFKELAGPQEQSVTSLTPGLAFSGFFTSMTYAKAGLITLALLPFLNVLAIPIGAYLLLKASKQQKVD